MCLELQDGLVRPDTLMLMRIAVKLACRSRLMPFGVLDGLRHLTMLQSLELVHGTAMQFF